jgi:multiple sugar transport system permease protein
MRVTEQATGRLELRRRDARRAAYRRQRILSRVVPYVFVAPFTLLFLCFLIAPLVYALGLSLFRDTMIGGRRFVGLDNYLQVVLDPDFWGGIYNMVLFGIIQIPIMLALSLAFALVLHGRQVYGGGLFRVAFFVPYAVPSVIAALIWGYLYGPAFGPVHQIARFLHVAAPDFLSEELALPSLANIVVWEFTGYNMVILYAALQTVPPEVEEAAAIDGARSWQTALYVKLPMIGSALALTAIFAIVHTLQLFNEPQLMAAIAPQVIGDHFTPNLYAYSLAFNAQQLNYSAAVSFTVALLVALLAYGFMHARRGTGRH